MQRDYIREFEYRDFSPSSPAKELIHTEEGYIRYDGSTGVNTYHYYLKDHLGNVRGVLRRTGATTGTVEQQSDYYPFGLQKVVASGGINRYLYNGKELQGELGYYDYGARQYDPLIGRWNVVDPVAEGYKIVSPYAYVGNDPVLFLDPNGMYKVSSDGTITLINLMRLPHSLIILVQEEMHQRQK